MHITNDSMVPVLRNKVLKFRFYMYLKEGLYTWTIQSQYLIYFLRLNFLRWRLNRRISQKIAPRRKIQLYGIILLFQRKWGMLFQLCLSILLSEKQIFRHTFLRNYWWQPLDFWHAASASGSIPCLPISHLTTLTSCLLI